MDWLVVSHFLKSPEIAAEWHSFMPLFPLLLHNLIVVNIPSDCSVYNVGGIWAYLIIAHLSVFGYNIWHYSKHNGFNKPVLIKSLLITLNFNAWVLIRAKPFKCLFDFNPIVATLYIIKFNLFLLWFSKYICKKIKENNGNQF